MHEGETGEELKARIVDVMVSLKGSGRCQVVL